MSFNHFSNININEIIAASLALFAVIDPLGSIPIYIKFKHKIAEFNPLKIALFAGLIMLIFFFAGPYILKGFDINPQDFSLAGALVLFILGLEMVLNIEFFKLEVNNIKNAFLTPLVFPLIAGPGTLTTLLTLQADYQIMNILIALVINVFLIYTVLRYLVWIEKTLAKVGLVNILHKIMGIILLAMAIKLFKLHLFA